MLRPGRWDELDRVLARPQHAQLREADALQHPMHGGGALPTGLPAAVLSRARWALGRRCGRGAPLLCPSNTPSAWAASVLWGQAGRCRRGSALALAVAWPRRALPGQAARQPLHHRAAGGVP